MSLALNRRIDHYGRNASGGRDLIVGDIHGCFSKLRQALDGVQFDIHRDRLFSVGDLVDRGPESAQACEWLTFPWFHAVRGNHEEMAIQWANGEGDLFSYKRNGGGWNIAAPGMFQQERAAMFATMPIAIELETAKGLVVIVHADCPAPSWAELKAYLALRDAMGEAAGDAVTWSRARIEGRVKAGVPDVRAVVVGHTAFERITCHDNVVHIDTGGWLKKGHFTLLNAADLLPVQAVQEWSRA